MLAGERSLTIDKATTSIVPNDKDVPNAWGTCSFIDILCKTSSYPPSSTIYTWYGKIDFNFRETVVELSARIKGKMTNEDHAWTVV